MCKIFGYCFSLIFYTAVSLGLFYTKIYTDCQGTWNCKPSGCEEEYMWYDLWGCMMFFGPVISILNITHCGFTWWKMGSLGIASAITLFQILSVVGCCCVRKKYKGKGGKSKKKDKDEKSKPLNTVEV